MTLLSREAFKREVFSRDKHQCVMCCKPGVDAHHLIERKLWPDGGYYVDNGVTLCSACHWRAEQTHVDLLTLRFAAGITNKIVPPDFDPTLDYDKWGNVVTYEGTRIPGPMFNTEQVQKILKPLLYLFV